MAENMPRSDIHNTPEEQRQMLLPSLVYTSLAERLYGGIKHPNMLTREDQVSQIAIQYMPLGAVAGQMLPPPNTASQSPGGVRMSLLLRQFEEQLTRVQNFILGAP